MEKEVIRFNELPDMTEKYLSLCRSLDDLDIIKSDLYEIEGISKEKFDGALGALDKPVYLKFHEKLCCAIAELEAANSLLLSLALSLMNHSDEFPFRY